MNPTDEDIQRMLDRIYTLAKFALDGHPKRDRAIEMLSAGAWMFSRGLANGRHEFSIGWWADPRMRPADADPTELIVLMRLPRTVIADLTG